MSSDEILPKVQATLAEFLKRDPESIQPSLNLREDLGLDSVATIELLFEVEDAFDLQIPNEDLKGLATVQDVLEYVRAKGVE
jgi:acyl carrier protein